MTVIQHIDRLFEAQDLAGVDSLPKATQDDLVHWVAERSGGMDYQDVRHSLLGLVEEPAVRLVELDPNLINMENWGISDLAVDKYVEMRAESDPPPVVVAREGHGEWFLQDGGHRTMAARKAGVNVPAVDISAWTDADWPKWLAGEKGSGVPTLPS